MTHLTDVLVYLLRAVYRQELPNSRLTKMVYLADWRHAIMFHRQITSICWVFNHFGPYVPDVLDAARTHPDIFAIRQGSTSFGNLKNDVRLIDPSYVPSLEPDERVSLDHVVTSTSKLSYDEFVRLVYSTYPVLRTDRLAAMDLVSLADEYRVLLRESGVPFGSPASRPFG